MKNWNIGRILFALALALFCAATPAIHAAGLQVFINEIPRGDGPYSVGGDKFNLRMAGFTGGHIYYTTNGTPATLASTEYTQERIIRSSAQLRVIAYDATFSQSATRSIDITLLPLRYLRLTGISNFIQYSLDGSAFLGVTDSNIPVGQGQAVTLRAIDGDGWFFDHWAGRHGSANREVMFVMNQSHEMRLVMYRTNNINPIITGNGTVRVDPSPRISSDLPMVQVTAIPDEGNFFSSWNGPSGGPSAEKGPSYYQSLADLPRRANFAPLADGTVSLTVIIDGYGTVTSPTSFFSVLGRTNVVAVQPAPGWYFSHWSGASDAAMTNSVSVVANSNIVLTAHLKPADFYPNLTYRTFYTQFTFVSPRRAPNGLVIAASKDKAGAAFLQAFDANNICQWEVSVLSPSDPVIAPNGMVLHKHQADPGEKGVVSAFSSDGELLWQRNAPGADVSLAVDANSVYVSSSSRRVQRYDYAGNLIREVTYGDFEVFRTIVLDTNSNILSLGGSSVSFNAALDLRWARTYAGAFTNLLMADREGNSFTSDLKAFNPAGGILWTNAYTNGKLLSVGMDHVYIADNAGGKLSALDRLTGQKAWSETQNSPGVYFAIPAADGSIFAVYAGPTLRKISSAGTALWSLSIPQQDGNFPIESGNPILGENGLFYLGDWGFDVGVGPAPSGFPMIRGDERGSGMAYAPGYQFDTLAITLGDQSMTLRFHPASTAPLRLESSEDLEAWTLVQAFSGPLEYVIPDGAPAAQFYRVAQQ